MNFFNKKDSTLPLLKFPLTQKIRDEYDITKEMLENVAVTFSMIDADTGLYRIANVPANIIYVDDLSKMPDEDLYTLSYNFKLYQTRMSGRFYGEFCLDFLGNENCGKIKLPIDSEINIVISDSITKTTVI